MRVGTTAAVSRYIAAPPKSLYMLISDIPRMPEWSPECVACEWVHGSTGPVVGARFRGSNRRGLARWTTQVQVVTAREGREFAFVTFLGGRTQTKWTYRFEPHDGGTTV